MSMKTLNQERMSGQDLDHPINGKLSNYETNPLESKEAYQLSLSAQPK